jgi:hypothetical protein
MKFADYVTKTRQLSICDALFDEGVGQQFGGQKFPIPPNLAILLSLVPGGPTFQGRAMKYVFTDALYRAAKGRQLLAQEMSKRLGRPVQEYEVFSQVSHARDLELGALWEELKGKYFKDYEPKHIKLNMGGKIGEVWMSLPKFNAILKGYGLPEFHFGGTDGLIENMETGKGWVKGHPVIGDSTGENRFGIDLSHPRRYGYEGKMHEPRVAFGYSDNMDSNKRNYREPGWEPSLNPLLYTQRLNQSLKRMSDKAEKLLGGLSPDHPQYEQLSKILQTVYKGMGRAADAVDNNTFNQRSVDTVYYDDPVAYQEMKDTIRKALEAYNKITQDNRMHGKSAATRKPIRELTAEEIDSMVKALCNDEEMSIRQRLSSFGPFKTIGVNDKFLVSTLLNWYRDMKTHGGVEEVQDDDENTVTKSTRGGPNPYKGAFRPMTVKDDLPGISDMFEKGVMKRTLIGNLSPELLQNKFPEYFPVEVTEDKLDKIISTGKPFKMSNGDHELSFDFDKKSKQWFVNEPTGETEPRSDFWQSQTKSPIVLPGDDEMGFMKPHKFDYIPLQGGDKAKWLKKWDEFARRLGGDRAEEAEIVRKKAAITVSGRGGDKDFDAYKDSAEDAFGAFDQIMGSPKFYFGELGDHFAELLTKHKFDPHEVERMTQFVGDLVNKGVPPTEEALVGEFGPEGKSLYDLLLLNGKMWRIGAAASILSGNVSQVKTVRGKERSGVGAVNSDGETSDVLTHASTSAAADRLARGDTGSMKGKTNRAIANRTLIQGNTKFDSDKFKSHESGSEIYRREGEGQVGLANKPIFDEFYDKLYGGYLTIFKPDSLESLRAINAKINKLQNAHPNGQVIRAAGNAAVMDVIHDTFKHYITNLDQDKSKRVVAQMMSNLLLNPEGLQTTLTSDDEEVSSIDTQPLMDSIAPLMRKDKQIEKYIRMLQNGESLEGIPAIEEKPGMRVVGSGKAVSPAKPVFGGTTAPPAMPTSITHNGMDWDADEFQGHYSSLSPQDFDNEFPVGNWTQYPEPVRAGLHAQKTRHSTTGLRQAESLISINDYFTLLKETDAIYDGSKPTTFNWWGAVGDPLGKVIDGDVPVKKKKKHGRK